MKKYIKSDDQIEEKYAATDILSMYNDVMPNVHQRLQDELENVKSLLNPEYDVAKGKVGGSTTDMENLQAAQENIQYTVEGLEKLVEVVSDWAYEWRK